MFRYAYCGYAPPFARHCGERHSERAHSRRTRHEAWQSMRPMLSWHTGPTLGVRRPIRYLAYKLDLDDAQVRELAGILDRLKNARAQTDVDWRRSNSDLAGAIEGGDFDEPAVRSALDARGRSAEALRAETLEALKRLHRLLDPEQRRELAYLVRSGGITF